jgi:hypothetical protein
MGATRAATAVMTVLLEQLVRKIIQADVDCGQDTHVLGRDTHNFIVTVVDGSKLMRKIPRRNVCIKNENGLLQATNGCLVKGSW